MDTHFSDELKNLIKESRLIAINLGYDYISTFHFFLADCKLNDKYTIKNFVFKSSEQFQEFFIAQKIDNPTIFTDNLPLTVEAEKTINKAFMLWNDNIYQDNKIHPYHLFLAASQLSNTLFYAALDPKEKLDQRLENYYIEIGQLNCTNIHKGIWNKLYKKLFP